MLVEELRLNNKNGTVYYVFWDTEKLIPVIYKADYVRSLVAEGNLGVYNTIKADGNITVSNKNRLFNSDIQVARKHSYYETVLDVSWLSTGVPCFSGVCVINDKATKADYVWCKLMTHAKHAKQVLQFIDMCTQVLSKKFTDVVPIKDIATFKATEDEKYAYSNCILISVEALRFIMSDEGKQYLIDNGCKNVCSFLLDVSNLSTFDYISTNRLTEKPKDNVITTLVATAQVYNTQVLQRITNRV